MKTPPNFPHPALGSAKSLQRGLKINEKTKKEQREKMKIRKKPPHHLASTGAQVDKVAKRLLLPPCATALLPSSEVAAKVSSGYDSEPSLEVITHHLSSPFPLPPLPPSVYLTGPPPFPPSLSSLYLTG
jgi:hypothetical protein